MASEGKKPARRGRIRPWAVALWLLVWQGASMAIDQQILLVSPVRVVVRLLEMALTAELWTSIGFSLLRIGAGFLLAAALGAGLAALSARFSRVEELLAPAMLAIQSVPVASFIILALIWFSSRSLSVLISFLMVLPVLYANTLGGIRAADAQLLEMAQVFRIPAARRVRYRLPAAGAAVFPLRLRRRSSGSAGRRASRPRSSACRMAPSASGCSRPRST